MYKRQLAYQIDYPAVPRVVLVFPSIAQIIGGAARVGGLNGLYPGLGSTVAWAACRVPVIKYAYPAQLGTHLLVQSGYNGNVGFFLPDGQGGPIIICISAGGIWRPTRWRAATPTRKCRE